jgi:hypothetical protein
MGCASPLTLAEASPTAGTEDYRIDELETALAQLVADGTITSDAASAACRRLLTLALEVPWDASPNELAEQVKRAVAIEVGGHKVRVLSAAGSARAVAPGIKALRKVPGVGEVLDRAKVVHEAPRRRVKVTHRGTPRAAVSPLQSLYEPLRRRSVDREPAKSDEVERAHYRLMTEEIVSDRVDSEPGVRLRGGDTVSPREKEASVPSRPLRGAVR